MGEGILMSEKKKTLERYCLNCKKSVECILSVWFESAAPVEPPPLVAVRVDAHCSDCNTILAGGRGVIELY